MLKARANKAVIIGLSHKNLELLKQGKPIVMELGELMPDIPQVADMKMVIFSDSTEDVMAAVLRDMLTDINRRGYFKKN